MAIFQAKFPQEPGHKAPPVADRKIGFVTERLDEQAANREPHNEPEEKPFQITDWASF
jgi:hypothetical protein